MINEDIILILSSIRDGNGSDKFEILQSVKNDISINDFEKIYDWLIENDWTVISNTGIKLRPLGNKKLQELLSKVEKEGIRSSLNDKQLRYNTRYAKLRLIMFWPTVILAFIGGIYSSVKIIEHLSTSKTNTQEQNPIPEIESEQSTLHTLPLDHKNQDSLNISSHQFQTQKKAK